MLYQLGTILLCFFKQIGRNFFHAHIFTEFIIENVSFHLYKVNDAFEFVFTADWQLNRNCITLQTVFHHLNNTVEISAHNVHLVDVSHTRYFIFFRLTPYSLRLRLNTTLCAENSYRTVQYAQRTLNFNGEVNVAWGVDDVNSMVFPEASSSSRSNGNTSFLLLSHPVHSSRTVMCFTNFMVNTCVEQNTFCGCRFTSINVSHDTNITSHL